MRPGSIYNAHLRATGNIAGGDFWSKGPKDLGLGVPGVFLFRYKARQRPRTESMVQICLLKVSEEKQQYVRLGSDKESRGMARASEMKGCSSDSMVPLS